MIPDSPPSLLDRLTHKLFPGSTLRRAWTLTGGISAETTALEIANSDAITRRLIVRRPGQSTLQHNPQAAEDEFRVLQLLHSLGLATPEPYALDSSGEILPSPYLVMAYIDGQPDFSPADPTSFAEQMAAQLAHLHTIAVSRADLSFLPDFQAELAIHHTPTQVNESLQEGHIIATLAAAWPFPRHNPLALLHGDYWPGNILWNAGQLSAVIDWEDAAVGDPLADLAITRLDLLWIYGRAMMERFTQAYLAQSNSDIRSLPYWDLNAALRLVRLAGADLPGWAAFFHPYGRADITEQSIREHYAFFVAQALDQLAKQ